MEIAEIAWRHPTVLIDYARTHLTVRRRQMDPPPPRLSILSAKAGLRMVEAKAGGAAPGQMLQLVRTRANPTHHGDQVGELPDRGAGDPTLGELMYALVRAVRPTLVVETGVATGVTSAYVLAALADNDRGMLESIDLPPPSLRRGGLVGAAVPPELLPRWTYRWGSARRWLPRLLAKTQGRLGVFLHDSDHSYANMSWELMAAWEALAPGGWLVADDAHENPAMEDVARAVGESAIYVSQPTKAGCTGLLPKMAPTSEDCID